MGISHSESGNRASDCQWDIHRESVNCQCRRVLSLLPRLSEIRSSTITLNDWTASGGSRLADRKSTLLSFASRDHQFFVMLCRFFYLVIILVEE